MEDIAMTCSNIYRVILAIVNVPVTKPILYQFAWKLIKVIKIKNQSLDAQKQARPCALAHGFHR
jgi:hypothetical protein